MERTREVFGDYVSTYNFRDSIEDGATVPLFYENRIPELQIVNERFDEELTEILEAGRARRAAGAGALAAVRDRVPADHPAGAAASGSPRTSCAISSGAASSARRCSSRSTRRPRSECTTWSRDEWELHLAELRERAERLPPLERDGRRGADRVHATGPTWRSSSRSRRTRSPTCRRRAWTSRRTASGCSNEDLDERFKDPDDPFRLVFVCAMWMTGFDVPSCSTIYLDRPMRNHTLMQTIARANRVFPDKENGLIVDYVGVFRHLEEALADLRRGAGGRRRRGDHPRQVGAGRRARGGDRGAGRRSPSAGMSTSIRSLGAEGFEFIALRDASVEALLIDSVTRRAYLERSDRGTPAVRRDSAGPGGRRSHRGLSGSRATSPRGSARSMSRPTSPTSRERSTSCSTVRSAPRSTSSARPRSGADDDGLTSTRSISTRSRRGWRAKALFRATTR